MKFRLYSLLALVATAGLVACSDDPTDEGRGEPFAIVTDRSQTVQAEGVSFSVTAYTIDNNNRRISGRLEGTLAGGPVALDSTVYVQELSETRFFMTGSDATDGVDLTIQGHGLTKTAVIIVE